MKPDLEGLLTERSTEHDEKLFHGRSPVTHFGLKVSRRVFIVASLLLGLLVMLSFPIIQQKAVETKLGELYEEIMRMKQKPMIVKVTPFEGYLADVTSDQDWKPPDVPVVKNISDLLNSGQRYLIIDFYTSPGLGNQMFQYATLRAAAEDNNATVIVPIGCGLRHAFKIQPTFVTDELAKDLLKEYGRNRRSEKACGYFEPKLFSSLFADKNDSVHTFYGYLQSYRYFHHHADIIRREFTFFPEIQAMASRHFRLATERRQKALAGTGALNIKNESRWGPRIIQKGEPRADLEDSPQLTYIGLHVRHGGDITEANGNVAHGHTAAPKEYFERATDYFRTKYWPVVFIIASDNTAWVQQNIKPVEEGEFYILPPKYREVDFATLMMCNHTIDSTGTFSWWIAYMTNGETLYSKDWPRPGSELDHIINKTDFFPPQWISM